MTQITSGFRSVLSIPFIYELSQRAAGAHSLKKWFVKEYVTSHQVNSVLDIGCGPGSMLSYLPKVDYYGYDISSVYINKAKRRYGKKGVFVAKYLTVEDVNTLPKFDLVIMSGVLHHIADQKAKEIIEIANEVLLSGGRLITIDGCYVEGQSSIAKLLLNYDRGQHVRTKKGYVQLASTIFATVVASVQHRVWIPYTYCFMECTKTEY